MWRVTLWTIAAGLIGLAAAYGLTGGAHLAYERARSSSGPIVYVAKGYEAAATRLAALLPLAPKRLAATRLTPPAEGKAILADLEAMTLELYENGVQRGQFPILARGRAGTPWETPSGRYAILTKEENHFSSIGKVWMPKAMQFFGNFFIHGWPHDGQDQAVPTGYSGGCIRLSDDDAARVFEFAELGTPVLVAGAVEAPAELSAKHYEVAPASVLAAKSYLVADLDSGEVLLEKNPDQVLPIASISKLMTALVSLDAINQYQTLTVSKRAVATEGDSGHLKAGEQIEAGNLIYPLLLESSNDAAEALAESYGRDNFIKLMNERSKAIGLDHTRFADPSGLSAQNVSTANDLFRLTRYLANSKPYVLDVSETLGRTTVNHQWSNDSDTLDLAYFLGGKNGFTPEAGQTMLSVWSLPFSPTANRRIAVVILGSNNRKTDAEKLLAQLKSTVKYLGTDQAAAVLLSKPSLSPTTPISHLTFVGDIMLDRGVKKSVEKNAGGNFDWLFSEVGQLAASDLLFGNLEGPVSARGQNVGSQYSFRMDPVVPAVLARAGFDALSVANNHAGDWGVTAFADTVKGLEAAGLKPVGGGLDWANASQVQVFEKNGVKFGLLGATDVGPNWLKADEQTPGVIVAADPRWPSLIAAAAKRVDVLIVSYHFGEEYQADPSNRQKQLAHLAIDNGAKVVVGHHPHVAEPVEYYKGGVIVYSLGNFIFDQYFSPATMEGQVLWLDFAGRDLTRVATSSVFLDSAFKPSLQD